MRTGRLHSAALLALLLLGGLLPGTAAEAHDARPLSVLVSEYAQDLYRVTMRVPPSVLAANQPELRFPDTCQQAGAGDTDGPRLVRCPDGLAGKDLAIHYPAFNPSLTTLIRFTPLEGPVATAVLPPEQSSWTVAAAPDWRGVAGDYLRLGITHILGGIDHLLFVAGLMLLAGTARRIFVAVTGFTVAHSITLSLSVLGLIQVPIAPTEAAIALSIVFLATEVARGKTDGLAARLPLLVSFVFGLLHGLGFASALSAAGLPEGALVPALAFFNLGVEVGQIGFILAVAGVIWTAVRLPMPRLPASMPAARVTAAYGLGIPAAYWVVERVSQF